MKPVYRIITVGMRLATWVASGRRHAAPIVPDTVLQIDPEKVVHKPAVKPPSGGFPPTTIAGGDWDCELIPICDDPVYRAFHSRFIEDTSWEESGYIEFLSTDVSEYGGQSTEEVCKRCNHIDKLYEYIRDQGYHSQRKLEMKNDLLRGLDQSFRPPAYREIAVNVTREGEFVWHAGMHRLVIAKLLSVDSIPVRINVRHAQWQAFRDEVASGGNYEQFAEHPDIKILV